MEIKILVTMAAENYLSFHNQEWDVICITNSDSTVPHEIQKYSKSYCHLIFDNLCPSSQTGFDGFPRCIRWRKMEHLHSASTTILNPCQAGQKSLCHLLDKSKVTISGDKKSLTIFQKKAEK